MSRLLMNLDWPEALPEFEGFLKASGLDCQKRGTVPQYGEKLALYGNGRIAVRVWSERGRWFLDVGDTWGRPDEWYDAALIRDLVGEGGSDVLPITEQINVIRKNWPSIIEAFSVDESGQSHERLASLRNERVRRLFPGM